MANSLETDRILTEILEISARMDKPKNKQSPHTDSPLASKLKKSNILKKFQWRAEFRDGSIRLCGEDPRLLYDGYGDQIPNGCSFLKLGKQINGNVYFVVTLSPFSSRILTVGLKLDRTSVIMDISGAVSSSEISFVLKWIKETLGHCNFNDFVLRLQEIREDNLKLEQTIKQF